MEGVGCIHLTDIKERESYMLGKPPLARLRNGYSHQKSVSLGPLLTNEVRATAT